MINQTNDVHVRRSKNSRRFANKMIISYFAMDYECWSKKLISNSSLSKEWIDCIAVSDS